MSNHKAGENPARRIPKVSHATSIDVGLADPKARPKGVADGQQVNIPALPVHRHREPFDSFVGLFLHASGGMSTEKDGGNLRGGYETRLRQSHHGTG